VDIEILKLRWFPDKNPGSYIDAAFPVLAYECEVFIPVDKEMDAYEETILKLISIGVSEKSIQKTLNISQSLCGSILANLEGRKYIEQLSANKYKLTQKAEDVLNNINADDSENKSKFGYIFVNPIRKDPLWYFHEGDIYNIPRSDAKLLERKIKDKNEVKMFEGSKIPHWQIEKAFSAYCRIAKIMENLEKSGNKASDEEVADLFAGIESDLSESNYQEEDKDEDENDNQNNIAQITSKNSKIRLLKVRPEKLYLQMRIVFDPSVPGGFLVESPFDFRGNDNELFLRQIQWLKNQEDVFIGDDKFSQFLNNEVNKLFAGEISDCDPSVIIIKKLHILNVEKEKYEQIYDNTFNIIHLMQQKNLSDFAKENIVGGFSRKLIEPLMNKLFYTLLKESREKTSRQAFWDFTCKADRQEEIKRQNIMVDKFAKILNINSNILSSDKIFSAIKKLKYGSGHSIYEKLMNLIVLLYYQPSPQIRHFFLSEGLENYIKTVEELNRIRNSASHAQGKFTDKDYEYFIDNVFYVANRLLEALSIKEGR